MVKSPAADVRDLRDEGSIPGLGRSPGGGHGNSVSLPGESPWIEEPDGLQSTGPQRAGHD